MIQLKRVFILLFFIILFCPMVLFLFLPNQFDTRFLIKPQFPSFDGESLLSGEYQSNINEYLNKNLFTYQPLTFLKTNIDIVMGKFLTNDVYITGSSLIDTPNLPDMSSLEQISSKINEFSYKIKKPIYSLIIPTSAQINSTKLPAYVPLLDETEIINKFNNSLDDKTIRLDANTPLTSMKNVDAYYRTDNRLSSFGAFLIYNYNIKQLGASPASMQKFNIEHVDDNFYGALFERTFYSRIEPDKIDFFHYSGYDVKASVTQIQDVNVSGFRSTLYDRSQLENRDKTNALFGAEAPVKKMDTNATSEHSIIIFADRNIDPFMQFFAIHYKKVMVVDLSKIDSYNMDVRGLIQNIDLEPYDQVLFAYGIESLKDDAQFDNLTFFADKTSQLNNRR